MSNQIAAPKKERGPRESSGSQPLNRARWILPVVLGAVLLVLIGILTYRMAFYDKVYNVSMGGVNLNGQSREESAATLEEHLQSAYKGKTLPLTVAGTPLTITSEQAGLRFKTESAALEAWEYGRTGGFLSRMGVAVSSMFSRKEIPLQEDLYIDTGYVDSCISQVSQQVDKEVVPSSVEVADAGLVIVQGIPGQQVDREKLVALVVDRLTRGDFSPLNYEPPASKPQPIDLTALYDQVYTEPQDAKLDNTDKQNLVILPEVKGVSFDQAAAQTLLDQAAPGDTVRIPFVFTPPKIDKATLEASLFKDELSTFTTYLNAGNTPRTSNIRLAASFINGTVLLPGEVFSYNGVVGQRTTDRGFKQAGAYVQGRLVDEVGGGICQMSTTLYGGAVRANLKIVERRNHSMTVAYVPVGQDATVNWGTTDLKFENDTAFPVKVLSEQKGSYVKVTFMGTKANDNTVSFESRTLSSTGFSTKRVVNPALKPGTHKVVMEGHTGYTAESFRVIKDKNGNIISKTLEAKSAYNKADQIIEVGPDAPATTNPPSTVTPPADNPTTAPTTDPTPDPSAEQPTPAPEVTEPVTQETFEEGVPAP